MKIKKLWVSEYKNVINKTFDFDKGFIALLVGKNGLGKSNVLEIIVSIFKELDLAEDVSDLNRSNSSIYFDFELIYFCKEKNIRIKRINSEFNVAILDDKGDEVTPIFKFYDFLKIKNTFLPDFIIGYYSGENKRVKKLFERHQEIRVNDLKKDEKETLNILGKLFFTDQNFGELIFFSLWVFRNSEIYGEKINDLFTKYLGIESNSEVNISFCNPDFFANFPEQNADNLQANISNNIKYPFWGIRGVLDDFLRKLYNNNSGISLPISYIEQDENVNGKKEFVLFNDLDYANLITDLGERYNSPIKLFDALHAAHTIGIINIIDTTLVKNGAKVNHNFGELSEGEQQLLTVLGLILIAGEFDTLFLLDEPDTHLNPVWQRGFISLIDDFNLQNDNSQFIVATHSPLIVQSSEIADVFLFKGDSDNVTVDSKDHHIHNWRIDQVLQSEYFGINNVRPQSLDAFMKKREEILSKNEVTSEDIEYLKRLDAEAGELPSGETLMDFRTLHSLKKILNEINGDDTNL